MKSKKLLSLLLAVIMIMSVVPMYASAATQIALKATHVTEWPTAEGEIYYGEPLSKIKLIGGKVVYEGVEVPGHFEHIDPNVSAEEAMEGYQADIKFVPDDTDTYKGFSKMYSKTTFTVHKTTPVLADESKPPVVTGTFEAGTTLSAITISDGGMINPYDHDESSAKKATWKWVNPDTVISESGYYDAKFVASPAKYEIVNKKIWVQVNKAIPIAIIEELPTVETFVYNPNITWSDVELKYGKAVIENPDGSTTEVAGSFSFSNEYLLNSVPPAGSFNLDVRFTPDDAEQALPCDFLVPVTVNPLPISFGEDHKGTSIDDPFVFEVNPNTKVGDVLSRLKGGYLNYPTPSVTGIEDANSYAENGKIYKVTVINYTNTNYTGSEAYVKTVFKDVEFAASSASYAAGTEEIHVTFNSNKAPGTFDVYLDGKLIGDDVKLANDYIDVPYKLETSGKHTVKVVYNPIENDYYFMADYETEIQANVRRYITLKDMSGSQYINVNGKETLPSTAYILYGDEISIKYGFEDLFASWVITDTAGKEVALDGVDLTSSEITFTMPDHDLVIAVKTTLDEEAPDDGAGSDDDTDGGIFGGICSFLQKIISWFINIIKQMMSFLGLGA